MTLAPVWRTRIFAAVAAILALWLGNSIAQEELALPLFCAAGIAGLLLVWLQSRPVGTLLLGGALVGYIVGNRGFAQLYVANTLPLLPAELVLLVGGGVMVVQSAFRRELPLRRDALNLVLLAWIIIGSARVLFDVRSYGFSALRDFAMVYYASFFFLAQKLAERDRDARFLDRCLLVACALLPVFLQLTDFFPDFFLDKLAVRGNPLIFYKGDLAGIFMGVGAVLFFLRFEEQGRKWNLVLSLVLVAGTLATNNRSSMCGLAVATAFLAIGGRWRFARAQAVAGILGALLILLVAYVGEIGWQKTPLYGLYERVVSIGDPLGQGSYSGEDTSYKGDNNLFRTVWWRTVFDETIEGNPWFGLGFGYDLANRFIQQYYPDSGEEFNTRSPHNAVLTIFARMGLAGLLPFLAVVWIMAARTIRAVRAGPGRKAALWCSAWIILVSACFGVVLEGPMGAIVFWTVLGLANAPATELEQAVENAAGEAAALQPAPRSPEVAVSP